MRIGALTIDLTPTHDVDCVHPARRVEEAVEEAQEAAEEAGVLTRCFLC